MKNKKLLASLLVGILIIMPGISLIGIEKAQAQVVTNMIANPSFETDNKISQNVTVIVGTPTSPPVLTSLTVVPSLPTFTNVNVIVKGTVQLTATPLDQNSVPFVGATPTFSSSDTAIVTVDSNGLLTGVKAGTATITTTSGSLPPVTTAVTVVTTPTTTRTLTSVVPTLLTPTIIATNETVTLKAVSLDQNNSLMTSGATITYASLNTAIATVDSTTGVVTGVSPGIVTITVTSTPETITPQGWQSSSWGNNTATFSYLNTGHSGTHSAKVQITAYTNGDAKWVSTPITIQPDTQYTYSDYYQSDVTTQVVAAFDMSDGTILNQIIGLPDPSPSTWKQFTTQFSVPLGAKDVTIFHLLNQKGSLTIDDVNLETYTPIPFNNVNSAMLTLTFDNGYQSTYDSLSSAPIKFPNTQFIITDLIGTTGYMTPAEINTLYKAGDEIASHTVTHDDLTLPLPTPNTLTTELSDSKTTLTSLITSPISTNSVSTDLAYPYGLYNGTVITATQPVYKAARGVEDGFNDKNFNPYDIKVQNVFNTTTTTQVTDWINQALATKTWLVLVYHSVDDNPNDPILGGDSTYNVTSTQLNDQLKAIQDSKITVLPMNQALLEINGTTPPTTPVLSSVTITPPTSTITVGATQTLTAPPLDQNGTAFVGATTTFSSGTPTVATVNSTTGVVTGVAVGTATITATSTVGTTTVKGTATVTVTAAISTPVLTSVTVTPATSPITVGSTETLAAAPVDQNNVAFTGATTTFTSSDPTIATVDSSSGLVTGVAAGTTTITAKSVSGSKTVTGTATVTVAAVVITPPVFASSGGGGGGGYVAMSSVIPGCDNRTTGFSATTGRSCLGNIGTTTTVIPISISAAPQVLGATSFHFSSTLKKGSRGNEVMELQKFLNNKGYNVGTVDGIFGTKVRAAVIKFQIANKLKDDGIVGPKVRASLNQ